LNALWLEFECTLVIKGIEDISRSCQRATRLSKTGMTLGEPLTAESCIALARALLDMKLLSVVQWTAGGAGVLLSFCT